MPHDVIMPALGMAQETGVIVAWLKQPGDAVKADDVLMEVETDKTTMEVEAGHDGFLTAIRAEPGVPVPVGDIVAVISETAEDVNTAGGNGAAETVKESGGRQTARPMEIASTSVPHASQPATATSKTVSTAAVQPKPLPESNGRVLASPKARRLAAERGIDLSALVAHGQRQPVHAADVEAATSAASQSLAGARADAPAHAQRARLRARAKTAAFDDLVAWAAGELGRPISRLAVLAAFAAGAVRAASGEPASVTVAAESLRPDGELLTLADPDRRGLGALQPAGTGQEPDLHLVDLTGTALYDSEGLFVGVCPALTFTEGTTAETVDLTLSFAPDTLSPRAAASLLADLVRRIETPLRHLL